MLTREEAAPPPLKIFKYMDRKVRLFAKQTLIKAVSGIVKKMAFGEKRR